MLEQAYASSSLLSDSMRLSPNLLAREQRRLYRERRKMQDPELFRLKHRDAMRRYRAKKRLQTRLTKQP